ncbi:MAG: ribosome maturation factor RimM [Gammaproteobacteria bacterium]|nr:ribosome maturation factor RimM [Gammaproteobacteria bacterium]
MKQKEKVLLGLINGLFGVKGWVKVYSYTRPRAKIVEYKHWYLGENFDQPIRVQQGRSQKGGVVAKLEGIDDREAAVELLDNEIWVAGDQLPSLPKNEYYWYQLIGLEVLGKDNKLLGSIKGLIETGANDVMVVSGKDKIEHLIPYIQGQVIKSIDLEQKRMVVDWNTDF